MKAMFLSVDHDSPLGASGTRFVTMSEPYAVLVARRLAVRRILKYFRVRRGRPCVLLSILVGYYERHSAPPARVRLQCAVLALGSSSVTSTPHSAPEIAKKALKTAAISKQEKNKKIISHT